MICGTKSSCGSGDWSIRRLWRHRPAAAPGRGDRRGGGNRLAAAARAPGTGAVSGSISGTGAVSGFRLRGVLWSPVVVLVVVLPVAVGGGVRIRAREVGEREDVG
jgi:hypothetical protein